MKKKIFTLLLAVAASIGTTFGSVKIGSLYYVLYAGDQTAMVTHPPYQTETTGNYDSENLTIANIPATVVYNNITYDVTSIGDSAFWICNELKSVSIPNSIVSIRNNAFSNSFITSVVIPSSVISIGDRAFFGTTGMSSVTIGDNVKNIGSEAFSYSGLKSVTIPENVTKIGNAAFTYCHQLTSVVWNAKNCNKGGFEEQVTSFTFGNNVEYIPAYCCSELSKITSIIIPDNVKNIGANAFSKCSSLASVIIGSAVENISSWAFSKCTGLTSISIPVNIKNIGNNAFSGCTHLSKVIWNAKSCSDFNSSSYPFPISILDGNPVTSFVFGEDVDTIPAYICHGMSNLTKIVMSDNVKSIGDYAFDGCTALYSVTIGNSVTNIGNYAFRGCTSLSSILIPNSVVNIGGAAFYECTGLTSITIPNSVTRIGNAPFFGCTGLTAPIYNDKLFAFMPTSYSGAYNIPDGIEAIVGYAFYNCTGMTSVVIPNSVTAIGNYAFYACSSLISATISNRVSLIGVYAFTGCSGMTAIDIPNSVTGIGDYSFQGCSGLTSATIGNGVTYVGKSAFYNCSGLTSITINAETPPTFGDILVFANTNDCPIYVPCGTKSAYDSAMPTYWYRFALNADCATTNAITVRLKASSATGWSRVNLYYWADGITSPAWPGIAINRDADGWYSHTFDRSISNVNIIWNNGSDAQTVGINGITESTCYALNSTSGTQITTNVVNCLVETIYYTVVFKDWNGTILKSEQVEEGHSATAPANPTRDAYTFTGWDKDFSNVQSDLTVTAQYTPNTPSATYYTVTFKDWNGTVLKSEQVEEGHSATAPANPTRDGYTFTGWDKDFSNVQSNLTVTAQYQKNETPVTNAITVRLKASSATGWSKVNLYYWANGVTSPAWPGITINRDADGWYSHTFDASVTSVNIIWNDGNNQTQDISNVTESTCYSLKSTSGKTIGVNVVECEAAASVSVTGVSLNKKTLQMIVGNTATLTASVLPANASNKSVTWTSSNTATATISSTGTISAKAEGVTTITCQTVDGNFTAECYVVVSAVNSEYTFSYEPTNATIISYTATELSYDEVPENNCVFAALADNAHTLNLMYVGSLVNGVIPQGNYKITSTLQNGTFYYSVGGDDQYDYGSYMATDFDSEGYYTSAYYIIAGDITIGSKNNYTVKVVSANGTDINVTYAGTQDVEIVPSEIKASKILHNGQIFILRREKVYTVTGLEVQ